MFSSSLFSSDVSGAGISALPVPFWRSWAGYVSSVVSSRKPGRNYAIWECATARSWIVCNVTGAGMQRTETAFLVAVATMLLLIFTLSLHRCSGLKGLWHESTTAESIGKPRAVNVEQIHLLMNQGKLSNKEARFYTTSPAPEEPPPTLPNKKK